MKMNAQQVAGIVRALVAALGGYGAIRGSAEDLCLLDDGDGVSDTR